MARLTQSAEGAGLVKRAVRSYRDPMLTAAGVPDPPRATLADGAAGVAYFLLRHASFGGEGDSLEAADLWAAEAERASTQESGFLSPDASLDSTAHSMHYGEPGAWWVRALVAAATGDSSQLRRSARRFGNAAAAAIGTPGDVNSGSAGLLLGCAQLLETVEDATAVAPVRAAGEQLAAELATLVEREGARPGETALGYLGAAHGWAGVAQALLRWSHATSQPPPPQVLPLLERLIALRRPSGRWPIRAGSREVWLGWCHGSAGWAQLWTLAWQRTGEPKFSSLAEQSAEDAVAADEDNASLCCGRAGQAYAALTLYQATGEQRWLAAARVVAADAVRLSVTDETPAHRLFSGELGVALLVTELEDPTRAAMPVYQAIPAH